MKRLSFVRAATLMAATAVVATGLFGAFADSAHAQTGIANTKHNLSNTSGPAGRNKTDIGEICVFCHTPHGSNATAAAPLWNRSYVPTAASFTMYSSSTFEAVNDTGFISTSVSLACLSCHDGTQAMDTMINEPGSGLDTKTIKWDGTFDGKMTGVAAVASDASSLKNDHPVGMPYGKWIANGGSVLSTEYRAATAAGNGKGYFVRPQGGSGSGTVRAKDDFTLYTRTSAEIKAGNAASTFNGSAPFVECATCHDPHSDKPTFLRIENTGSAVCLTCHIK